MDLKNIENLLNAYFEGNTSLAEEEVLKKYFAEEDVAEHLLQYKPIFIGLVAAAKERSSKEIVLPAKHKRYNHTYLYAMVAVLVVALAIGLFYSQRGLSQEEKEALVALENSRNAMMMLSEKFNKGTQQIQYVSEFSKAKNMVFE